MQEEQSAQINTSVQIAILMTQVANIEKDVSEVKSILVSGDARYVTKEEFKPFKNLIYGLVAIILSSFVGGVAALIWKIQ